MAGYYYYYYYYLQLQYQLQLKLFTEKNNSETKLGVASDQIIAAVLPSIGVHHDSLSSAAATS